MYEWTKLVHVASAFGFISAHGASAAMALRLRRERDHGRVAAALVDGASERGQSAPGPSPLGTGSWRCGQCSSNRFESNEFD